MTARESCLRCRAPILPGTNFCPSCGLVVFSTSAPSFDRICAAIIDASICIALAGLLLWLGLKWWVVFPIWLTLTEVGYHLGGSIGKRLLDLGVPVTGRLQHFVRETVGKLASLATFGIGFVMAFSNERRALHDYMAGTSVLRSGKASQTRHWILGAIVMACIVIGGYFIFPRPHRHSENSISSTSSEPTMAAVVSDALGCNDICL